MNEWKDRARKSFRDAGKPYVNQRGELKRGKSPPKEVSVRTVYVQSIYLTLTVRVKGACRYGCLSSTTVHIAHSV